MMFGNSGSSWSPSGSIVQVHNRRRPVYEEADSLWERMYVNPKPVIIACAHCKAHNVITSPCCIQCGAPMGVSKEIVYA